MSVAFISEISSNHNCRLERCLALIDKAAEIGCQAVKVQLFRIDSLFAPEILDRSEEHCRRRDWEMPVEFLPALATRCRELKIRLGGTPFYLDAVEEMLPHVDFFKISSYELLWEDLLKACGGTGKPMMVATGMATLEEVQSATEILRQSGCADLTLLHCLSSYPAPAHECNLGAMETLRQACDCPVGWSDHSVSPAIIHRAVHRWQAAVVEFHLDLDGQGNEYHLGHCWLPHEIQPLIRDIRTGIEADGTGEKECVPSEVEERQWRADPSDGLRPHKQVRKDFK